MAGANSRVDFKKIQDYCTKVKNLVETPGNLALNKCSTEALEGIHVLEKSVREPSRHNILNAYEWLIKTIPVLKACRTSPQIVSATIPAAGPQVVSATIPAAGPQVVSATIPAPIPQIVSTTIPAAGPQVVSTTIPAAGPQVVSTTIPAPIPQVVSATSPASISQVVSATSPAPSPQVVSTTTPAAGPQVASVPIPAAGPQVVSVPIPANNAATYITIDTPPNRNMRRACSTECSGSPVYGGETANSTLNRLIVLLNKIYRSYQRIIQATCCYVFWHAVTWSILLASAIAFIVLVVFCFTAGTTNMYIATTVLAVFIVGVGIAYIAHDRHIHQMWSFQFSKWSRWCPYSFSAE